MEYFPSGEIFVENHYKDDLNRQYKFNGKEMDSETGYYYYGARYYNPRVSLWLNVDPLADYNPFYNNEHYIDGEHNGGVYYAGNLNPYIYCYQSPIQFIDPNGKQTVNNASSPRSYTLNQHIEKFEKNYGKMSDSQLEVLKQGCVGVTLIHTTTAVQPNSKPQAFSRGMYLSINDAMEEQKNADIYLNSLSVEEKKLDLVVNTFQLFFLLLSFRQKKENYYPTIMGK